MFDLNCLKKLSAKTLFCLLSLEDMLPLVRKLYEIPQLDELTFQTQICFVF